jgi:hypothetical protein
VSALGEEGVLGEGDGEEEISLGWRGVRTRTRRDALNATNKTVEGIGVGDAILEFNPSSKFEELIHKRGRTPGEDDRDNPEIRFTSLAIERATFLLPKPALICTVADADCASLGLIESYCHALQPVFSRNQHPLVEPYFEDSVAQQFRQLLDDLGVVVRVAEKYVVGFGLWVGHGARRHSSVGWVGRR